jgi:hypothetical protein
MLTHSSLFFSFFFSMKWVMELTKSHKYICMYTSFLKSMLHKSRAVAVSEWEEVGRCLCMASPDLLDEWIAWTKHHGLSKYPSLYGRCICMHTLC